MLCKLSQTNVICFRLFDWRPDKFRGERSKHEKIVIVKNLFDPADFVKDVKLILDYQQDLREECLKCGSVKKVIVYDVSLLIQYLPKLPRLGAAVRADAV